MRSPGYNPRRIVRAATPRRADAPQDAPRPSLRKILRSFWPFIRPYLSSIAIGTSAVLAATLVDKAPPLIMRFMVDRIVTPMIRQPWTEALYARSLRLTGIVIGAAIAIALLRTGISYCRMMVMQRAGLGLITDIRVALYRHLQGLSLSFFESRSTGDVMSRVTSDVDSTQRLLTQASDTLLTDGLNLILTTGILLYLSPRLTMFVLLPVPILVVCIYYFARAVRPVYRKIRDRLGEINAKLHDNLAGIRVIQAFSTEELEDKRFERESVEYLDMSMQGVRLWARFFPFMRLLQGSGQILVMGAGAYMLLQPKPTISLGDLFAFTVYIGHFYQPIGSLFRTYDTVLRAAAAGERIIEVFETRPEVVEREDAVALPEIQGRIEFRDVSFRYATGEQVLIDVNLVAEPGETIALVGRSGAGKTSIVNLIPRFYDPESGAVLVDGIDVSTVTLKTLRSQISIVLQDPFLFNGTVRENIRYARPDADDEQVEAAARAANADGFVSQLTDGYDTEIGERGVKLSGGQKQRLAIARAILAEGRILILDEATSMLDTESELEIQEALERLMEHRTAFVIAHRLSTVRRADRIIVLDRGRVVETGPHEELLERDGLYAHMHRTQFSALLEDNGAAPAHATRVSAPAPMEPQLTDETRDL